MTSKLSHCRRCLSRGFTLLELMVTLSVLGVLIAIAVPDLQRLIQENRLQSATAEFQSALALARTEAIRRGGDARVTVLATTANGTTTWNNGYTVFVNRSNATDAAGLTTEAQNAATGNRLALGEQLLVVPALNTAISLTSDPSFVTFNGYGRTITGNGAFLAMTIQITPAAGATSANTRCMSIGSLGRIRVQKYTPEEFKALNPSNACP
jgi:type IV fimbrial biogenesis protein FimT